MNGSFFSQIYTNGAILSIFFYFSTPFLYACVFGMGLFFSAREAGQGDTKDFLSLSKKVLVILIRFLCSFFSTARRTNKETPPQLSGFLACRYGRRRGLRNSLRSNSPRPFPSVFLATSPPDKGGDFAHAFAGLFNPSVLRTPPLYFAAQNTGEEDCNAAFFLILFCSAPQCCGRRQGGRG